MIDERFILVGVLINFFGSLVYVIKTAKGQVKPNRVTWFFWALGPMIAFFAEIKQGVGLVSLLTFSVGFGPICTFIASFFNKKAVWKLTTFDYVCGGLAFLGLTLWLVTKVGNYAILFSIFADATAALPTIKKSWLYPETEYYLIFFLALINAVIAILTIKTWNFATAAFPIYIFLQCLLLSSLIKFKFSNFLFQSTEKNILFPTNSRNKQNLESLLKVYFICSLLYFKVNSFGR